MEESNPDLMDLATPIRIRLRPGRLARLRAATVRRIVISSLVVAVIAGGWLWLRDSPVAAVKQVRVTGISSSQEARVRHVLETTARDMTTLHVRTDQLRAAVAPYASVADLRVDADFPHKLAIEVVERAPAALVLVGSQRIPVAAGGLLLRGVRPDEGLPVIRLATIPAGARLTDPRVLAAVRVLAAAPAALHRRIVRATAGGHGLQLELRDGPDLIFGSAERIPAKWAAAARVLADSGAQGAVYLDLRVPEWTAAGGVGPVEPEGEEGAAAGDPQQGQGTVPAAPQTTPATP
ncbi:MAG TPA: FtsQ-type POTRA domain-containing protein [Solirubrobacteraceae bacterium]